MPPRDDEGMAQLQVPLENDNDAGNLPNDPRGCQLYLLRSLYHMDKHCVLGTAVCLGVATYLPAVQLPWLGYILCHSKSYVSLGIDPMPVFGMGCLSLLSCLASCGSLLRAAYDPRRYGFAAMNQFPYDDLPPRMLDTCIDQTVCAAQIGCANISLTTALVAYLCGINAFNQLGNICSLANVAAPAAQEAKKQALIYVLSNCTAATCLTTFTCCAAAND